MALKFDMSNPLWMQQQAAQRQTELMSTLGEDIGTSIGMGAAAIAGKAKKKFGADYAKALKKHEAEVEKTGVEKDFMSMDEFKKQDKERKVKDKSIKRMQKDEQFGHQMDKEWSRYKAENPDVSKRLSRQDWNRQNANMFSDRFKGYQQSQRKEKFDAFGNKVKGIAGAGLATAAAPFALTGSALHNLFKKKDKSQPITSDPTKNPYNFPIGDEYVPEAEQAEHDKGYVSEGEAAKSDANQAYRDQYNSTGRAVSLGSNKSDRYTRGPVSMRTGKLAREEGIPYQMTATNPLYNPNLNTGPGFPGGQPQLGLSTGTEEEMLRNREVLTGSNVALPTGPDPLGEGHSLGNQSGKSVLMGRGDATPGTLVGEDGSSQDSGYNYDRTKDMSAVDQQRFAMVESQYGKDWENTASFADKKRIASFLNPNTPLPEHYKGEQGTLGMLGEAIGDTGQFYMDKAGNPFQSFGGYLGDKLYDFYND